MWWFPVGAWCADSGQCTKNGKYAGWRMGGWALQPHFAHGPLSHVALAQAHAMHLADHLSHFESR
ncbi:DUF1569 domain-containing protein [Hydrogenophaga soli]|nr:DUF1569 domain-containing protein [Burkholderiaceae bacterium]